MVETSMDRQKSARLIRFALGNLSLRESLVVGGWSEQATYSPVAVPPEVLAAAERDPDLVRRIEQNNERLIAFLKERLPPRPSWPPPDYATIKKAADSTSFVYPAGAQPGAGRYRVYFNRHGAAPLVWCVALVGREEGVDVIAWELAVADVKVDLATVTSHYQAKAAPDHEDGRPSAWLEVDGVLIVTGSAARIARRAA